MGIELKRVDLIATLQPDTVDAFDSVLTGEQEVLQEIANARTDAERTLQMANEDADRTVEIAQAKASERLAKAQADTADVLQLSEAIRGGLDAGLLPRDVPGAASPPFSRKPRFLTMVDPRDDAHLLIQGAERLSAVDTAARSRKRPDADEKRSAGSQLALAMLALGLLVLALIWMWLVPEQPGTRQLILAAAAALVAVPGGARRVGQSPASESAWHHDQLIAIAMLGAWVTGDLLTAVLLPVIMILGHVLEERSVIGTQEAIESLGKLTHVRARRIGADGEITEVDNAHLKVGDLIEGARRRSSRRRRPHRRRPCESRYGGDHR